MTDKETLNIIATIVASYPSYDKLNDAAITSMVRVWQRLFKDDDAKLVGVAVAQHISTSKWPPSVAEVRERMMRMQRPELLPPDQAWALVHEVLALEVCRLDGGRTEIDKVFPEPVLRAVKAIGWGRMIQMYRGKGGGYKPGEDKRTFMDFYSAEYERERAETMTPPSVHKSVKEIRERNNANGKERQKQLNAVQAEKEKILAYIKGITDDPINSRKKLEDGSPVYSLMSGTEGE